MEHDEIREEAVRIIGEDHVPVDVLRELVRTYGVEAENARRRDDLVRFGRALSGGPEVTKCTTN